tara:strand:- start:14345 stop:15010 length:666 start_codon:yes stop_codon:yes gene_type:complete
MSEQTDNLRYAWIESISVEKHPRLGVEKSQALRTWVFQQLNITILGGFKRYLLKKVCTIYPQVIPAVLHEVVIGIQSKQLEIQRKEAGGTRCSCCNQYVKEYKRALSKNMCRFLQSLVYKSAMDKSRGGDGFVHFKECDYGSHDYPYVKEWGLAERSETEQGYYRPTELGIKFAFGKVSIPKHIYTYNGKRTGETSNETIKITDVKFERFDLESMLNGIVP